MNSDGIVPSIADALFSRVSKDLSNVLEPDIKKFQGKIAEAQSKILEITKLRVTNEYKASLSEKITASEKAKYQNKLQERLYRIKEQEKVKRLENRKLYQAKLKEIESSTSSIEERKRQIESITTEYNNNEDNITQIFDEKKSLADSKYTERLKNQLQSNKHLKFLSKEDNTPSILDRIIEKIKGENKKEDTSIDDVEYIPDLEDTVDDHKQYSNYVSESQDSIIDEMNDEREEKAKQEKLEEFQEDDKELQTRQIDLLESIDKNIKKLNERIAGDTGGNSLLDNLLDNFSGDDKSRDKSKRGRNKSPKGKGGRGFLGKLPSIMGGGGVPSGAGKGMASGAMKLGSNLLKASRFLGPVGLAISAGMSLYDGFSAATDDDAIKKRLAEEGKDSNQEITIGDRAKHGAAGILSGLTFGLVSKDSVMNFGESLTNFISGDGYNTNKELKEKEDDILKERQAELESKKDSWTDYDKKEYDLNKEEIYWKDLQKSKRAGEDMKYQLNGKDVSAEEFFSKGGGRYYKENQKNYIDSKEANAMAKYIAGETTKEQYSKQLEDIKEDIKNYEGFGSENYRNYLIDTDSKEALEKIKEKRAKLEKEKLKSSEKSVKSLSSTNEGGVVIESADSDDSSNSSIDSNYTGHKYELAKAVMKNNNIIKDSGKMELIKDNDIQSKDSGKDNKPKTTIINNNNTIVNSKRFRVSDESLHQLSTQGV